MRAKWIFVSLLLTCLAWARPQTPVIPPGTQLKIELQTKVDSKKSKVGDKVVAKLNQDLKVNGAKIAAKSSLLTGIVTEVDASQNHQPAKIGVLFDQLQPKDGAPIAVRAAIFKVDVGNGPGSIMMSPELANENVTFNNNRGKYANMDKSSNGVPIEYAVMETATGTGADLGGVIQSVSGNFNLDSGTHVEVRFLHN